MCSAEIRCFGQLRPPTLPLPDYVLGLTSCFVFGRGVAFFGVFDTSGTSSKARLVIDDRLGLPKTYELAELYALGLPKTYYE